MNSVSAGTILRECMLGYSDQDTRLALRAVDTEFRRIASRGFRDGLTGEEVTVAVSGDAVSSRSVAAYQGTMPLLHRALDVLHDINKLLIRRSWTCRTIIHSLADMGPAKLLSSKRLDDDDLDDMLVHLGRATHYFEGPDYRRYHMLYVLQMYAMHGVHMRIGVVVERPPQPVTRLEPRTKAYVHTVLFSRFWEKPLVALELPSRSRGLLDTVVLRPDDVATPFIAHECDVRREALIQRSMQRR